MKNLDQDRGMEQLDVYVYPLNYSSSNVTVYAKSRCPLSVKIVRIWINDEYFNCSLQVAGMEWNVTEPINIEDMLPSNGTKSFKAKVTMSRGNTFASLTGPLYCTDGVGWGSGGTLSINTVIVSERPSTEQFNIKVMDISNGTVILDEDVSCKVLQRATSRRWMFLSWEPTTSLLPSRYWA